MLNEPLPGRVKAQQATDAELAADGESFMALMNQMGSG